MVDFYEIISRPEFDVAIKFWSENMYRLDGASITDEQRASFSVELRNRLKQYLHERVMSPRDWHSGEPIRFRINIINDWSASIVLDESAKIAGVDKPSWPNKLFMTIEPGRVILRDRGGSWETLYEAQNPSSIVPPSEGGADT